MGYGIKLTEKQWDELDNLRFRTPSADVFRNCLIILMSNSHDTIATIARYLGCGTDTVVRIRRLYRRGGIDYSNGRITYTVAATKSGYNFLGFLMTLVKAYAGRKIRLVCDNGRFHHTQAVRQWLKDHKNVIQIFWLPPYCPSLNLIERLWGHLKRTVLANVLFETMNDLVTAFCRGVSRVNGRRNKMGFIFDHDDVNKKVA